MTSLAYVGSELELFAEVRNWKSYWSSQVRSYISGDVLEVGAGIGSNTRFLDANTACSWVCLEPDPKLLAHLRAALNPARPNRYEGICGTVRSLDSSRRFDTIIYIDVLEHIEDHARELQDATAHLRPGGRIIVLAPAHQALYTPFDAAIGHFRRYSRASLLKLTPPTLRVEKSFYLDSCGLLLSLGNKLFLQRSMPTKQQLTFWDRYVIPLSRFSDYGLFHQVGKSIVAIWRLPAEGRQ